MNDHIALLTHEDRPKDTKKLEALMNSDFEMLYQSLTRVNKRRFWANFIDKIYVEEKKIIGITFL